MNPPDWMRQAACLGLDPEMFFPEPGGGQKTADHAKQICAQCPVTTNCLTYALNEKVHYGIWGGTTPDERPAGRRPTPTRPINHGTEGGYMAHRRRNEPACTDCLAAHATGARERTATRGGW